MKAIIRMKNNHYRTKWTLSLFPLVIVALSFFLLPGCSDDLSTYTPTFIKEEPPVEVPEGLDYEFGYLQVPENRNVQNSRQIELPVYHFKSINQKGNTDPVIYLVGGPGSSIMNAVPYIKFYAYLQDRDFILLEQRGTKYGFLK